MMSKELFRKIQRQAKAENRPLIQVVEEHLDAAHFRSTNLSFDCITQEKNRRLLHKLVPIMTHVLQDRLSGLSLEEHVAVLEKGMEP